MRKYSKVQLLALEKEKRARARARLDVPRDAMLPRPGEAFVEWVERLGEAGLKVDGKPFSLRDRPAMRWIYAQLPSTPQEAFGRTDVLQKCAQVGFTIMEILFGLFVLLAWEPVAVGMYLPDMKLAGIKSDKRFMPIVRTIPAAYKVLTGGKASEGNVLIRSLGSSNVYFLWTSGKAMTESIPLDVLTFDEVQGMLIEDMEKTRERLSASRTRYTLMGSTALWPDADINFWFRRGTQHQFHTHCRTCGEHTILDEHFPECIGLNRGQIKGAPEDEYVYVCAHCGGWLDDPQRGQWIAKTPNAPYLSIHFPQFLSPTISARDIIESYNSAQNMQNFFNRKLGKPYVDPTQMPLDLAMLNDRAEEGIKAGLMWKSRGKQTYMGIDNMGGFSCILIAERMPDNRMAFIHAEAIYGVNPWGRMDQLMEDFNVSVCVSEQLPNYDSAKSFAKRWDGRVFLVSNYANIDDDMLRWGDATVSKADRKTDIEYRDRYTLAIDQYKLMSWAFARIANGMTLFPDAGALVQEIEEKNKKVRRAILRDVVFDHFCHTALVVEQDEEEHKSKRYVRKVGIDPHFSFAYMLLCAAWCRAYGTASFILPTISEASNVRIKVEKDMPGLPSSVLAMFDVTPDTCSSCTAISEDGKFCQERRCIIAPRDPVCPLFIPRSS